MRNPRDSYRLGLLLVTLGTVCFSAAGYFTRLIALDTWTMLFWRSALGALTILAFIAVQRRGRVGAAFASLGGAGWLFSVTCALCMTAFLAALRLTTVAHVVIIYATLPFIAALLGWQVLRERAGGATLLASVLAFAGVALTVLAGLGEGNVTGDLLSVGFTLLTAIAIVLARRYPRIPMVPACCVGAALAAAIGLPLATFGPVGWHAMLVLALFGASNLGAGMILTGIGCTLIPAVETGLLCALETPLAPLWVWLAFGETPLPTTLAGGALVMAAVVGHVVLTARRPVVREA
jgi:drug/metabolite transporter (DMT)-like permease